MDLLGIGATLCAKYVLPYLTKIAKSAISNLGKSLYERLSKRFASALDSFEKAVDKMNEAKDEKKLKKRIICCELGLKFFGKIYNVLEEVLPEYTAAVENAKAKYEKLTGEKLEGVENEEEN